MERLEELRAKFPMIPKSIILKTDLLREGIRYTPVMRDIGRWTAPDGTSHGFQWDHQEDPLTAGDSSFEGWLPTPENLKFRDGTTTKIEIDKDSPYEVKYEGDGRYMLYGDQEPVQEVFFRPRPEWYSKRTGDGTPMSMVFGTRGHKR